MPSYDAPATSSIEFTWIVFGPRRVERFSILIHRARVQFIPFVQRPMPERVFLFDNVRLLPPAMLEQPVGTVEHRAGQVLVLTQFADATRQTADEAVDDVEGIDDESETEAPGSIPRPE